MWQKRISKTFLLDMVQKFPGILKIDDYGLLFCSICSCNISGQKRWNVDSHMNSNKHKSREYFGYKNLREEDAEKLSKIVEMFPGVLEIDNDVLFCKLCCSRINGLKMGNVKSHFLTNKHKSRSGNSDPDETQDGEDDGKFSNTVIQKYEKLYVTDDSYHILDPDISNDGEFIEPLSKTVEQKKEGVYDDPLDVPGDFAKDEEPFQPLSKQKQKRKVDSYEKNNFEALPKRKKLNNVADERLHKSAADSKEENFDKYITKRSRILEVQYLEMRNYKLKLEIWEKEKQLQLPRSKFTKEFGQRNNIL